jgi:hypothetical protein
MTPVQTTPDPEQRPSNARMYDYFLGGYHNFAIDRAAAERVLAVEPDFALFLRANRAFLRRVVTFAVNAGSRQFLDLGAGIPTVGSVHEVAQAIDPACRVVYVDNDPIAVALSQDILADNSDAVTIQADVLRPEQILQHPDLSRMLDLGQPMALLVVAFLHLVPDDEEALRIVRFFRDAMAPGSYVAVTHATGSFTPERSARTNTVYNQATSPVTLRTLDQMGRFFEGFELIEPGIVPTPSWRPESRDDLFASEPERGQAFAGVGRKP